MSEESQQVKVLTELKFKSSLERIDNLPWPQRTVPFVNINPCIQPYKQIEELMFDLHDEGKIKKMIIQHGIGVIIPFDSSVSLHYACYIENNKKPFDSSSSRSQTPKHYQLGGGYLFSGFEIALSSMRKYEIAQFLIDPDYAFGKIGCPPRIPGNVQIMLVIYVSGFLDCGEAIVSKKKPIESLDFCERLKLAQSHKALGIDFYNNGKIKLAFHHFRQAQYSLDEPDEMERNEIERQNLLCKCYVNQMMCLVNNKYFKPKKILEIAVQAEKYAYILEKNPKFHYCLGIAYTNSKNFLKAEESFNKAQTYLQSVNQLTSLTEAIASLRVSRIKAEAEEKTMWNQTFNKLGYSDLITDSSLSPEEILQFKRQINETLNKFVKNTNITKLILGTGYTNDERKILLSVIKEFALQLLEYKEDNKIIIQIIKS